MRQARLHLIVLVGTPGSGKSTYAARLHNRCPTIRLISPDTIRERLYPGYAEGRVDVRRIDDHKIFRFAYREVAKALHASRHVLFDATSLTITRRKKLITMGRRHGASITARYFPIPLHEAFRRNRLRIRRVPQGAIVQMLKVLIPPEQYEGFDRITVHRQSCRHDG